MPVPVFSSGEVLTAANMNQVGMWRTGSASPSALSNVDITSCFSSNFNHYRVMVSLTNSSISNLRMRVLSGTSTPETGLVYDRWGFSWATSASNQVSANEASLFVGDISNLANTRLVLAFDIFQPNAALETHILPYSWGSSSGQEFFMACRIETTTAYTGLRFFADAGTLTGNVAVYGYTK